MKKVLFLLIALFMFGLTVKAECLEKEYINWANDLKPVFTVFNYNDYPELDVEKYQYAYFLSLSKTRDDITFSVIDKNGDSMPATNYEELKIYGVGLYKEVEGKSESYKIEVYGNARGTCNGELITTLNYTVPAYNEYYKTSYCDKYKDHELCQVFTDKTQDMTFDEFKAEMKEYEDSKDPNILRKVWKFLVSIRIYLLCVIIPAVGVSIYYNTKIKKYKKMRNRNEVRRKKHKEYLFVILLLLLSVVKVNASLTCGDTTILEGPITTANWRTNLIMCQWSDKPVDNWINGGSSYDAANTKAHSKIQQTVWAADGKSASTITVPLCVLKTDEKVKVKVVVTSSYSYEKYECTSCCNGKTKDGGNCTAVWEYVPKTGSCKDEYTEGSDGQPINGDNYTVMGEEECGPCADDYSSEHAFECSSSTVFKVNCPNYKCTPVKKVVEGWCNATFKIKGSGDPAYCVNPSDKFPNGIPNNYQSQKFDPSTCKSSNSTPDCGFANILIEAAYYNQNHPSDKIAYETINFALRLWSAEVQLGGFYRVGLAYVMGYNCNEYVAYPAGNPNVYIASLDHITKLYFASLSKEGVDHSVEGLITNHYFNSISCGDGLLGVVCEGRKNTYIQAFALYFNTYFGNAEMQNHLAAIYGDRTTEPIGATVTSEVIDQHTEIEVKYREEITPGQKIECGTLKSMDPSKLNENQKKVLQYCNNEITHVIGVTEDGTYVDLGTGKPFGDLNGDGKINEADFLLLPEGETYDFSYCQKNSCFSPTVYFALCDIVDTEEIKYETIYTTIRYTESKSKYGIKKYIACGSGDYQIMFSYDDGGTETHTWDETTTEEKEPVKTVTVDYYCYDAGGCDNYSVREEDKCGTTAGGYGTHSVKDPSLRCIMNMRSSISKKSYDYSDFFGVNSNFCRIYCSDTVDYYLADKVDIYSGLSFKLDIEHAVFKKNNLSSGDKAFSNIVLMKRDCVSEIFYDRIKFPIDVEDWTTVYEGLPSNPKSWKELHDNLKKYGLSSAHINEIEYDLYNCNLYSSIPSSVYRPKNDKMGNIYSRIKQIYSEENSYGFDGSKYGYASDAELSSSKNTVVYSNVKYDGGAQYVGKTDRVGDTYNDIKMGYVINSHNSFSGNVSPVKYCTGESCFNYDPTKDEYLMPHNTGHDTSNQTKNGIPTNDYAYFSIVNEVDFYNASKFQVEPYTGNIHDATEANNRDDDYADLDPYLYPVGKDAASLCKSKGECDLYHQVYVAYTYYRKVSNGTSAFKQALSGGSGQLGIVHKCPISYKEIPIELTNEVVYRNVDLGNMFPSKNSDGTRRMGKNWKSAEAYVNEIENYIKSKGQLEYYNTHKEFSYTFSQDSFDKIKEYDATVKGVKSYTDNSIEKGTCKDANGNKVDCKTSFISSINNDTNKFGINNNRASQNRGVSDYTREIEESKEESN